MSSFRSQWCPQDRDAYAHPSLDRTLFLDTFTRGAVNRCTATLVEPSGKGINVALALHSHGVPALAVLPSGGPAGEQLVQLLDAAGLPCRAVTITGTIRTNVSMIEANGTSSKINEPGPTLTSDEVAELLRATLDSCSSPGWLAICGTLPNGFSERDERLEPLLTRRLTNLGWKTPSTTLT